MSLKYTLVAALLAATPALADIEIVDPYARASGMSAKAGAAFFEIRNTGDTDDRLVDAAANISQRVELHTHKDMGDGVMKMMHVPEGFAVPAGGSHTLQRGGDHVMFMGLKEPMEQGDVINVTLTFEQAGDVVVEIPVDLERKPMHGAMNHGDMKHGDMKKNGMSEMSN